VSNSNFWSASPIEFFTFTIAKRLSRTTDF
jgi:hypothetical protein